MILCGFLFFGAGITVVFVLAIERKESGNVRRIW